MTITKGKITYVKVKTDENYKDFNGKKLVVNSKSRGKYLVTCYSGKGVTGGIVTSAEVVAEWQEDVMRESECTFIDRGFGRVEIEWEGESGRSGSAVCERYAGDVELIDIKMFDESGNPQEPFDWDGENFKKRAHDWFVANWDGN